MTNFIIAILAMVAVCTLMYFMGKVTPPDSDKSEENYPENMSSMIVSPVRERDARGRFVKRS